MQIRPLNDMRVWVATPRSYAYVLDMRKSNFHPCTSEFKKSTTDHITSSRRAHAPHVLYQIAKRDFRNVWSLLSRASQYATPLLSQFRHLLCRPMNCLARVSFSLHKSSIFQVNKWYEENKINIMLAYLVVQSGSVAIEGSRSHILDAFCFFTSDNMLGRRCWAS